MSLTMTEPMSSRLPALAVVVVAYSNDARVAPTDVDAHADADGQGLDAEAHDARGRPRSRVCDPAACGKYRPLR